MECSPISKPRSHPEQARFDGGAGGVRAIEDRIIDWDRHECLRNVSVVPQHVWFWGRAPTAPALALAIERICNLIADRQERANQ